MDLAWTSSPLWLVINVLVAFRLTRLWIDDSLPPLPRVRHVLRNAMERRWQQATLYRPSMPAEERDRRRKTGELYEDIPPLTSLLDCYWCAGFWISLGVFLLATFVPLAVWAFLAVPLALSALVGLLSRLT